MSAERKNQFEEAGRQKDQSLLGEFVQMLKENKKYWLIPFLVVLLGFALLLALAPTAAAPFIYSLF